MRDQGSFNWDGIGIILFSCLITSWMVFLLSLENGFKISMFSLSVVVSVLFYMYEKRQEQPFININFFRKNINITLIYAQYILTTIIFFSILLSIPTFLQTVKMASSRTAGLTMLALSIFAMVTTPLATRWMERAGFRPSLISGAVIGIIGVLLLLTVSEQSLIFWISIVLAVFGISNGIQNIGLQNLLYSFIASSESGLTTGLLMTSRFIGNILASSIYGIMFATGMTDIAVNKMGLVLLVISVVLIPGMLYITKHRVSVETTD